MSLESFFKKLIQSNGSYLLYPLSWLYASILFLKKKIAPHIPKNEKITVISVGNLDLGGSGKTPTTLKLLGLLDPKKGAVISRGYKSDLEHEGSSIANPFKNAENASQIIGDEPLLILQQFSDVLLLVGKDRKTSLKTALDKNCKWAILDDGGQVQSIYKDFNIILCDPKNPIKPLFPSGYRRDLISTLKAADFVVFTYCSNQQEYASAKQKIAPYYQGPTCGFKARLSLDLEEKNIAVLCAIAQPERFLKQLEALGYQIKEKAILDDHARISKEILEVFFARCMEKKIAYAVCTEKDFVKLPKEYKTYFKVAKLSFEPSFDASFWESFIGKIQKIS